MSLTNRSEQSVDLFKDYSLKNKMQAADCLSAEYSENLKINLTDIKPSIAGPKRPQDKIELINSKSELLTHLPSNLKSAEFILEDQNYKLAADLELFCRLTKFSKELSIANISLEIICIATGGVSNINHFLRMKEVIICYLIYFKFSFIFPFFWRYYNRLKQIL